MHHTSVQTNEIKQIPPDELTFVGSDLNRPECVLTNVYGDIYTADGRGGVTHILPNGEQKLYQGTAPDGRTLHPNGISLQEDGSFLIAHLDDDNGGVFRLRRNGEVTVFLDHIDGSDLPPTNFVFTDQVGRTWITVSTRKIPRDKSYRKQADDGFIVMVDNKGARIVADNIGYTNEAAIDPSGQWLFVNETFGRSLLRFPIKANGELGQREVVTKFNAGVFPDGLAFDALGGAWITSIVSNRIIRVLPDGTQQVILDDSDPDHVAWVEGIFQSDQLGRPHMGIRKSRFLKNLTSLAFGGKDLRTGYLGCLLGDSIGCLRLPVAGLPPAHWNYR